MLLLYRNRFVLEYSYPVAYSRQVFAADNRIFARMLQEGLTAGSRSEEPVCHRLLFVIDASVERAHHGLSDKIENYLSTLDLPLEHSTLIIEGGEPVKSSTAALEELLKAMAAASLDRHSLLIAIGGGALLDMAGFAAAIFHRGVRLARLPTTVLSQNDSGVGVKNGINYLGQKNLLGTFAPPHFVLCDSHFLTTLAEREWRDGLAESLKVALIRDRELFTELERLAPALRRRELCAMEEMICRTAKLHIDQIGGGGDPFESGSSRPLDFGHWLAHWLESASDYQLTHGEAVATGIAVDTLYSERCGLLAAGHSKRVLALLESLGFGEIAATLELYCRDDSYMEGIEQFRQHLGGELSITLLSEIGSSVECHSIDRERLASVVAELKRGEW